MLSKRMCALASGTMAILLVAGCHVDEHKSGDSKDVNISTPFGGLNVKTNEPDVLQEIGLPAYPGALAYKNDDADKDTSADVNMSFGGFHLRVKTADYRTNDAPDKVQAFYMEAMKRHGDVIVCRNNRPVGELDRTSDGLTCDNHHGGRVTVDDKPGKHDLELKAGSAQHQRIVSITPDAGGTKFGLVVLDLPGNMSSDSGDRQHTQ